MHARGCSSAVDRRASSRRWYSAWCRAAAIHQRVTVHRPSAPTLAFAYEHQRRRSLLRVDASDLARAGRLEHRDRCRACPSDAEYPCPWCTDFERLVVARKGPVLYWNHLAPSSEREPARVRIEAALEQRIRARIVPMPAPVVEHVRQRVSDLPHRTDILPVVAICENTAAAAFFETPSARIHRVARLRRRDLERAHAIREAALVVCLDEQMNMRVLDAEMHDAELVRPRDDGPQRVTYGRVDIETA